MTKVTVLVYAESGRGDVSPSFAVLGPKRDESVTLLLQGWARHHGSTEAEAREDYENCALEVHEAELLS